MQVELSTVLTIAGSILVTVAGIYLAILKYTIEQKDHHQKDQHDELQAKLAHEGTMRLAGEKTLGDEYKRLTERMHMDELSTVKMQGDLSLLRQAQESHAKSFDDLVQNVVTKREFEARMDGLEASLKQAVTTLERAAAGANPTRYGQRYPTPPPIGTSNPPKRGV